PAPGAPLFRRYPWSGIAGLYSLASLAGVPGTPGALLWFASARSLAAAGRTSLLLVMAMAWLAGRTAAMRQWRPAVGVSAAAAATPPPGEAPLRARMGLWVAALGLVTLGAERLWQG